MLSQLNKEKTIVSRIDAQTIRNVDLQTDKQVNSSMSSNES